MIHLQENNITLSVSARAIAYNGASFWILISDGSFKKLDKSFSVLSSYSKSSAIPDDLVYNVQYYDIAANDNYVYITYNGCTDTSGSSSKFKSCIAKYNKEGIFSNDEKAASFAAFCAAVFLGKVILQLELVCE
ncbi:hypothetical protein [Clostridium sp. DJ247]|uniref:hypothetical protein n=1 Tax=Clostridium sp. DJ247 TaxID=2726188 RepID=UPI0016238FAA|nr:hypothetical protein [Clostridium sp. DJ247]MBC2578784.1 hypothetical protein [Clostridium sp. DJ247]